MKTLAQRGAEFKALHEGEAFVIPNPWDAGSAKVFAGMGFGALATTSSGFAFTLGLHDGGPTLNQVIEHTAVIAGATDLPLSVDLENGHGPEPRDAATAIKRAADAGAVGGSIEDFDPEHGIYERNRAAQRIAAAVDAARGVGFEFTLTARAENHIRGNPDLEDTIARLQAYEAAGADVLYAPGLRSVEEIRAVAEATSKPLNVLARPKLTMSDIAAAGGTRVSLGGSLAWVAAAGMIDVAGRIRDNGDFSGIAVKLPDGFADWLD